jgi:predicted RNA methylase
MGRSLLQTSGSFTLKHLEQIQSRLPTQSRRSPEQIALQQFSTPLPLAYIVAISAQIHSGDRVLEPSAGTGMLAIWAELAGTSLVLNEIDDLRRHLLHELFPQAAIASHNAEQIDDYLDRTIEPTVVIMNPPFSASPKIAKRNRWATLKHLQSALRRLLPGGRLVCLSANWFSPNHPDWIAHFEELGSYAQVTLSVGIEGQAYAKHGTTIATRLTIIDRVPSRATGLVIDRCLGLKELLEFLKQQPPRAVKALPNVSQTPNNQTPKPKPTPGVRSSPVASTPSAVPTQALSFLEGFTNAVELEYEVVDWSGKASELTSGIYETYEPQVIRIAGARVHPTPLVQSAAMASVAPPPPTYRPLLPRRLTGEGILSVGQLEAIIYAGNAHEQLLSGWTKVDDTLDLVAPATDGEAGAVQFRRGFFIGDGTGLGKGRECAAVILDNWHRGRKKSLWISKSDKLVEDARRDWCALGGIDRQIVPLSKFAQGDRITLAEGIIFVTYATLRTEAKPGKPDRVRQLIDWLGNDFEGVIVFDEAHAMANSIASQGGRGLTKPSQQAVAGLRLQRALPLARVLYVSATGATKLSNLSYLERLGLWGTDTQFASREDFISSVSTGGIAALEVVARDLKALGLYTARSLSFAGVGYEILEHQLTAPQVEIYNTYAEAYQIIHQDIESALEATNVVSPGGQTRNGNAKSAAYSAFEVAKQRFFNHLLLSMKCPTLLKAIERDLEAGHAVVIQLVSTDEALLDRRLAEIPTSQWGDINVDITPREYLFDYLMSAFPIHLHEVWTDDKGVEHSRLATDADGNPVICQSALAQRNDLIERLAMLPPVPSALDQILHRFGHERVAECTGRSKRIVRQVESGSDKLMVQRRSSAANIAETQAFQEDRKPILIFSQAGGTGRSYHADLDAQNQRLRRHYLVELGWRADEAIQGLGRTHRSHQKQPPVFVVVCTNVKGEKRFTSTIARRLDSLGALTKGQRQTGSQGMFRESDNLESAYALAALKQLYYAIYHERVAGFTPARFAAITGLTLTTKEGGLKEDLPPMSQFLNRCLAMPIADQESLFEELEARIESAREQAIEAGTYEVGVETLRAERLQVIERSVIYRHPVTGAVSEAVKIEQAKKTEILLADEARARAKETGGREYVNQKSGRAAVVTPTNKFVGDKGEIVPCFRLTRPASRTKMTELEFGKSEWQVATESEFVAAWEREVSELPEFNCTTFYLIVGLLLPIWKKLDPTQMKVYRLQTDTEQLLGRVVESTSMPNIAAHFGISCRLTAPEIYQAVMEKRETIALSDGLLLRRCYVAGQSRLEVVGWTGQQQLEWLKAQGAFAEIINWKMRAFVPTKAESALAFIEKIRGATPE